MRDQPWKQRRVMRVLPLTQPTRNKTKEITPSRWRVLPSSCLKVRCVFTTHMKVICVLPLTFTSNLRTNRWWKCWRRNCVIFPWNLQCFFFFAFFDFLIFIGFRALLFFFLQGGQGVQTNPNLTDELWWWEYYLSPTFFWKHYLSPLEITRSFFKKT